jgi:hypothetical protein
MTLRSLTVVASVAGCLFLAAPAGASVIVGSALPAGEPQLSSCFSTDDCSFIPQALASGTVAVPSAGVITAFHAKVKSYAYLRFRVDRGTFAYHEPATSVYRSLTDIHYTVPNGGTQVFTEPARIPVEAGDRVGADTGPGYSSQVVAGSSALRSGSGTQFFSWGGGINADFELLVNAVVEPDSDHDGYGDETQDCKPTDPTRHDGCAGQPPGGGKKPPPAPKPPVKPPPKVTLPKSTTLPVNHSGDAVVATRCEVPPGSNVVCSGAYATYAGTGPGALGGLLSAGGDLFAAAAKAKRHRPVHLKIGSARFRIAAGTSKQVKIPLNRRARKALRQHGTLKVLLVTTLKLPHGRFSTKRRNVTLRPAKS